MSLNKHDFDFRSWMLQQTVPLPPKEVDKDHYTIETDYGISEINFYNIDPDPEVIELRITCKKTGNTKFFLHFQAVDEQHSKDLYKEMATSLMGLKDVQTTRILLCCTAGMTTTFFAEKMNEVASVLELDYNFHAVSVSEVYANAKDYDLILVAPQVGYELPKLQARITNKPVLMVPTAYFASYDANACIEFVKEELTKFRKQKKQKKEPCCACKKKSKKKILVIATAPSDSETFIRYRIYDHGTVTKDERTIKKYLDIKDLEDIIDIQISQNTGTPFDCISIAIPGVIHEGKLDLPRTRGSNLQGTVDNLFDIQSHFQKRHDIPIIIENNANCAALGWYSAQDEYSDICFMSQPNGWLTGGQGIVVNGKLVRGAHGIAGELKHILNHLQIDNPLTLNPYHIDTVKQIVTKSILVNVSILDPEVVVIRCEMLPDMDELHDELLKYLPASRIPKLVHIDDFNDYVLGGLESLSLTYIKKGEENDKS